MIACEVNRAPDSSRGLMAKLGRAKQRLPKHASKSSSLACRINAPLLPAFAFIYDLDKCVLPAVLLNSLRSDAILHLQDKTLQVEHESATATPREPPANAL
jgi:hypothetical protein